jgi:hypothetical protein
MNATTSKTGSTKALGNSGASKKSEQPVKSPPKAAPRNEKVTTAQTTAASRNAVPASTGRNASNTASSLVKSEKPLLASAPAGARTPAPKATPAATAVVKQNTLPWPADWSAPNSSKVPSSKKEESPIKKLEPGRPGMPNLVTLQPGKEIKPQTVIKNIGPTEKVIQLNPENMKGWGGSQSAVVNVAIGVGGQKGGVAPGLIPPVNPGFSLFENSVARTFTNEKKTAGSMNMPSIPNKGERESGGQILQKALKTKIVHSGGHYPGDLSPEANSYRNNPSPVSLEKSEYSVSSIGKAQNYAVIGGSFDAGYKAAEISKSAGLSAKVVISKKEVAFSPVNVTAVDHKGQTQNATILSIAASDQTAATAKVGLNAKTGGTGGGQIDRKFEAGITFQRFNNPEKLSATDAWINPTSGKVETTLTDPTKKSRGITPMVSGGVEFTSESLVPGSEGDSKNPSIVGVYAKVPKPAAPGATNIVTANKSYRPANESMFEKTMNKLAAPEAQSNDDLLTQARRMIFKTKKSYLPADQLSAEINKAAASGSQDVAALRYVRADTLGKYNPEKTRDLVDSSGNVVKGYQTGEEINTGGLLIQGQKGVFIKKEDLPAN